MRCRLSKIAMTRTISYASDSRKAANVAAMWVRRAVVIWLSALLVLPSMSPRATAGPAEPQLCKVVRFGLFGYSDIAATTALASQLLRRLGYTPVAIDLSIPVIFQSLAENNIDVFLGNWMPAQEGNRNTYVSAGKIDVVGPNLEHAKFTLAVPHYLYAAGLTDFASIKDFADPLHSTLYGIEPGAAANRLVLGMIMSNAFGLGSFKLVESSEQGMLTELQRAYNARKPIVFVAWDPHPMNLRFQIDYLSGGDRTFGPNFGGATINTLTRAGYRTQCPNVGTLLGNLQFTLRGESEMMAAMLDRHEQPDAAAKNWLEAHPEAVRQWLRGVSTFGGRPSATLGAAQSAPTESGRFEKWMVEHKLPAGNAVAALVERARTHGTWFFEPVSGLFRRLLDGMSSALSAVPALALIGAMGVFTWIIRRSWQLALFVAVALVYILNQGYWGAMLETLSVVLVATLICAVVGIPLGVAGAHNPRFFAMLRPVLDLMQTLPAFVYLIPTLVLFGLGPVPALLSTVIFALPAPIRFTQAGIAAVPAPLKEAGAAFGASDLQLLWKVELPSAYPMILAGITQSIMLSLSMVVIAGLVGAGGLGVPVVRALNSVQMGVGFEAGLAIVLLAIILDRVCRPVPRRNANSRRHP
jgi:glycine betaine/proline transport system substrate-binding protein